MLTKSFKYIVFKILRSYGYSSAVLEFLYNDLYGDLFSIKAGIRKRLWAYRRGFLARRVNEYGLNDLNWKEFETDFHYFRLYPFSRYSKWIDDKLTFKYLLHPFSGYLPKYYFELRKGDVRRLMDCPPSLPADLTGVLCLLRWEGQLVLKLLSGSGGLGFYKLSVKEEQYMVNDQVMGIDELHSFLGSLSNYLVTEYLFSHEFIRRIWSGSPNTLRIMTVHHFNEEPVIVGAYIRFGTGTTGFVENIKDGAVACGVDIENGALFRPVVRTNDRWLDTPVHKDTKTRIEGQIPHWEMIAEKILEICRYVPQLNYMGFDVVITQDGFKIIEINSLGAIYTIQLYYRFLKNESVRRLLYGH
jgi:hypothetical protein